MGIRERTIQKSNRRRQPHPKAGFFEVCGLVLDRATSSFTSKLTTRIRNCRWAAASVSSLLHGAADFLEQRLMAQVSRVTEDLRLAQLSPAGLQVDRFTKSVQDEDSTPRHVPLRYQDKSNNSSAPHEPLPAVRGKRRYQTRQGCESLKWVCNAMRKAADGLTIPPNRTHQLERIDTTGSVVEPTDHLSSLRARPTPQNTQQHWSERKDAFLTLHPRRYGVPLRPRRIREPRNSAPPKEETKLSHTGILFQHQLQPKRPEVVQNDSESLPSWIRTPKERAADRALLVYKVRTGPAPSLPAQAWAPPRNKRGTKRKGSPVYEKEEDEPLERPHKFYDDEEKRVQQCFNVLRCHMLNQ